MLDERITLRTEEYVCPTTGETKVRTVEYIEKVIEKEVRVNALYYIVLLVIRRCVQAMPCVVLYFVLLKDTLSFVRAI